MEARPPSRELVPGCLAVPHLEARRAGLQFSGSFTPDDSAEEILNIVSQDLPIPDQRDRNTVHACAARITQGLTTRRALHRATLLLLRLCGGQQRTHAHLMFVASTKALSV